MSQLTDLIADNIVNAQNFAFDAANAALAIAATRGVTGYSVFDLGESGISAKYKPPLADATPLPFYDGPESDKLPKKPILTEIRPLSEPELPVKPTLRLNNLYLREAPNLPIPEFNEADPETHIGSFLAQIKAIEKPALDKVVLPAITPFPDFALPSVSTPEYVPGERPGDVPAPSNYAVQWKLENAAYHEINANYVNDQVRGWLDEFAPQNGELNQKLFAALLSGIDGDFLGGEFEDRLYLRHENRIGREWQTRRIAVQNHNQRGWIVPPGAVVGAIQAIDAEMARALSGESTNVAVEIMRLEAGFRQAVIAQASSMMASLQGQAVQMGGLTLSVIQASAAQASEIAANLKDMLRHELDRANFRLALMDAIGREFDSKFKAAFAAYEKSKVELEVLAQRGQAESRQMEAVKLALEAQETQVGLYAALVGAVKEQAFIDELSIKNYQAKSDAFGKRIDAVLASYKGFDAYLSGEKGRLDGELGKLSAYSEDLKAIGIRVDIDSRLQDTDVKANSVKLEQFSKELAGFEVAARIALQKFIAGKELKAIGLDNYRTDVNAAINEFSERSRQQISFLNARVEAFKANSQSQQAFQQLNKEYVALNMRAAEAVSNALGNVASAFANATNTSLTLSGQA